MIEAQHLTKRYGKTVAVDEVSFVVQPGRVTGFLGPNGAGKSTTMRMILGLDAPSSGSVLVNGKSYRELNDPLRSVGALLDAKAIVGGRSAANHLTWLADSNGIDRRRVGEVLDIVGLSDVAGKRVGTFSLGMSQRLGIAAALLGDPDTLIFDEPINGLDPDGIVWIRNLMKSLAVRGAHGVPLQPSHERDGPDRRSPARHRPGSHHRRRQHRGIHQPKRRPERPRPGGGADRPRRRPDPARRRGRALPRRRACW